MKFSIRINTIYSLPVTTGGGTNLEREVDTTLSRKSFHEAEIDAFGVIFSCLQTLANSLKIGGGVGSTIQRLDPVAAISWDGTTSLNIVKTWREANRNLSTSYGGHGSWG